MDDPHTLTAVAYTELNPVRARLVDAPEVWRWSSAAAHIAGTGDGLIDARPPAPIDAIPDWSTFLAASLNPGTLDQLRRRTAANRGLGTLP